MATPSQSTAVNATIILSRLDAMLLSIVSSSSVALILLFFILGFICGCCFKQKYDSNKTKTSDDGVSKTETKPYPTVAALYEDILPNLMQQNLEMEQNAAYGSADK